MSITRENYVTKSVNVYLKERLEAHGYTDDVFALMDSYPHTGFDGELDKTYIAAGFNFDDGGKQAEMGSTMKFRLYTIEFFIFGKTRTWAQNIAHAVKFSLENDQVIPVLDITDGALPQIDSMPVIKVSAEHQPVPKPKPWEENIWTVHLRIEDCYDSALAVS